MFEIHLTINAPPRVQKNDLHIHKKISKAGKVQRWVGHSNSFSAYRNKATVEMYRQYVQLGYKEPIDFFVEVAFVFYLKGQEADLDNLIAAPLDALMGLNAKRAPGVKVSQILKDDNLVKKLTAEKIMKGNGYDGEPRTELTIREYKVRHCYSN